jgi:uncharacterized protein
MKTPLANVFTLGVQDLAAQIRFYRALGFESVLEVDDFIAFELRGSILCLFPVEKLAGDARAQPEPRGTGVRFAIGILVDTPEEVDASAELVRQAGGTITKEPVDAEFFEGRSCYFADPESNYFEIVWSNPENSVLIAAKRAAGLVHD